MASQKERPWKSPSLQSPLEMKTPKFSRVLLFKSSHQWCIITAALANSYNRSHYKIANLCPDPPSPMTRDRPHNQHP